MHVTAFFAISKENASIFRQGQSITDKANAISDAYLRTLERFRFQDDICLTKLKQLNRKDLEARKEKFLRGLYDSNFSETINSHLSINNLPAH
jgi:hypothetical protein